MKLDAVSVTTIVTRLRARWGGRIAAGEALDSARWRRLLTLDPSMASGVVRALYVAILAREPDPAGLAHHSGRLSAGLPLESLIAELARARDAERTAISTASPPREVDEETRDRLLAVERTSRALTRRLAALEDRLLDGGEETGTARRDSARS